VSAKVSKVCLCTLPLPPQVALRCVTPLLQPRQIKSEKKAAAAKASAASGQVSMSIALS
jgi:hypothetical protein